MAPGLREVGPGEDIILEHQCESQLSRNISELSLIDCTRTFQNHREFLVDGDPGFIHD